ncbi:MAG: ABC transporter permease [Rhodospirillaceae bacterium]|nr:ABC transporter permease [Rhodospirillaceae bacterium]
MLFGEVVRVALQSIRANLFRACLTMLGIVIGVAAVITMLAAGSGAQQRIEEQIDALGANLLNITADRPFFLRGVARAQLTLEVQDVAALQEKSRYLDSVVPTLEGRNQVKYGSNNVNVRVLGTTHEYTDIFNYRVAAGRMFTAEEDGSRQRVAVLGSGIPGQLEIDDPAALLGEGIAIRGVPFTVIGILEEVGSGRSSPDQRILLPLRTAEVRVLGSEDLDDISVRVRPGVSMQHAMVDIERVLRAEHRIRPGQPNDFAIYDRRQFLETREEAQQTFTILLASIAGVSLLVGGIGIMNIMLVSVTERTREIGVRMALGATRFNILMQFLVESMLLCLLGGLLGVAAGVGMAELLSRTAGWVMRISPESVVLSFTFSIGVGLFFGILPARRAAKLDPIEALRYE